jgi:hypothetical protein
MEKEWGDITPNVTLMDILSLSTILKKTRPRYNKTSLLQHPYIGRTNSRLLDMQTLPCGGVRQQAVEVSNRRLWVTPILGYWSKQYYNIEVSIYSEDIVDKVLKVLKRQYHSTIHTKEEQITSLKTGKTCEAFRTGIYYINNFF